MSHSSHTSHAPSSYPHTPSQYTANTPPTSPYDPQAAHEGDASGVVYLLSHGARVNLPSSAGIHASTSSPSHHTHMSHSLTSHPVISPHRTLTCFLIPLSHMLPSHLVASSHHVPPRSQGKQPCSWQWKPPAVDTNEGHWRWFAC